jgi:hypothetical protein
MKKLTRREIITQCVKKYVENKPEEYEEFKQYVKEQRAKMPWNSRGEMTKDGKIDSEYDFKLGLSIPQNLHNTIDSVLQFYNQDRIFQGDNKEFADKEYKWFKEEFKIFVIPDLTHRQIY